MRNIFFIFFIFDTFNTPEDDKQVEREKEREPEE